MEDPCRRDWALTNVGCDEKQRDSNSYSLTTRLGIDLNVYHCGREVCQPGHAYGPAVRDHFLIHYILTGKGFFQVGDRVYHLGANQGFLICPDVVTYYEADREQPWTYAWVGFQGAKAELYLRDAGLDRDHPVFTVTEREGAYLQNCLEEMLNAYDWRRGRELRLQGWLCLFLAGLLDVAVPPSAGRKQGEFYSQKAVQYIERNYSRPLKVTELARQVGLERSYFSALFKKHLGLSPQAFLLRYRMEKACALMDNSTLSLGDIARSVGYEDPLAFSKMFKQVKGCSPREYRKQRRR